MATVTYIMKKIDLLFQVYTYGTYACQPRSNSRKKTIAHPNLHHYRFEKKTNDKNSLKLFKTCIIKAFKQIFDLFLFIYPQKIAKGALTFLCLYGGVTP